MNMSQKKVSGSLCGSTTIIARVGGNWFASSVSSLARVTTRFFLLAESPFHSTPIAKAEKK
jgi:hypothetical protein